MTRPLLTFAVTMATAVALAIPAVTLADDGGSSKATVGIAGLRVLSVVRLRERLLDRRVRVFSTRCLGQQRPDSCSSAADRLVVRLDQVQGRLERLKATVAATCTASGAPARCTNAAAATARMDRLLVRIAGHVAAIKAAYPDAGAGSS
jgi:hypothetical protein